MTDELELLREWDAEAAPLTDAARARARFRLYAEMAAGPAPHPGTRRRQVLRIAAGTAVAAAVTGTAVVAARGGADGTPERAGGPATAAPRLRNVSAATVLRGAAAHERRHESAIAPRDDQFIYTKEITEETEKKTGTTRTYVDESWRSVDGSRRSFLMEHGEGRWNPPLKKNTRVWPPRDWSELRKLPTDPEKLLLTVGHPGRTSHTPLSALTDREWFMIHFFIAGLLMAVPVMPEGLRPAAYEALAMVPGVETVPGVRDAKGRAGVAVTYSVNVKGIPANGMTDYLIFDPTTYAFLGYRDERTEATDHKTYIQQSYLDSWAVVDEARRRP